MAPLITKLLHDHGKAREEAFTLRIELERASSENQMSQLKVELAHSKLLNLERVVEEQQHQLLGMQQVIDEAERISD